MFINFNPFAEMEEPIQYTLEIHVGNSVDTQSVAQPASFATMQAVQLCQQLAEDSRPIKAVWKIQEYIKERPENDKYITNTAEFCNRSWVKEFGDENNE